MVQGKSTLGKQLESASNGSIRHIDGDNVAPELKIVTMKLGMERGEYTMYCVAKAILEGKVPCLSTGGGVLLDRKGHFLLEERIKSLLGVVIDLVILLPSEKVTQIESTDNPRVSDIYSKSKERTATATKRRLEAGEWTCNGDTDEFVDMIVRKSCENARFAANLVKQGRTFYFPWVTSDNYKDTFDVSAILDLLLHVPAVTEVYVHQFRILVSYNEKNKTRYGHITVFYRDYFNRETVSYDELQRISNLLDSIETIKGSLLSIGNIRSINITNDVIDSIVTDKGAHVTINSGNHNPSEMRNIAKAVRNDYSEVTLKTKNGKEVIIPLTKAINREIEVFCHGLMVF